MKKAFAVLSISFAIALGTTQSASALFLGIGTIATPFGECVGGWQGVSYQHYIFGFEVGLPTIDAVPC